MPGAANKMNCKTEPSAAPLGWEHVSPTGDYRPGAGLTSLNAATSGHSACATGTSVSRPHVESEILEIVPSRSRPDQGIVMVRSETLNQHDEIVQVLPAKLVAFRRPPGTS